MLQKAGILATLFIAFIILLVSVLRTAIPTYSFHQLPQRQVNINYESTIEYYFPYPGLSPGHPAWPLKAARDWAWLFVNRDPAKRAELLLLFADKRLVMAESLIKAGKADLGVPTAIKAEQYLESAYQEQEKAAAYGVDTTGFLQRIATASLKHKEILDLTIKEAPEDAKPLINQIGDLPKAVYEKTIHKLNEKGRPIPGLIKKN